MLQYCKISNNVLEELYFIPIGMKTADIIPSTITSLGASCFKNKKLPEDFQIPDHIKIIGPGAFENTNVKNLILPPSVVKVCDYAFANCKNLTQISFGNQILWGDNCFLGCDNLTKITQGEHEYLVKYFKFPQKFVILDKQIENSTSEYTIYKGREVPSSFPNVYKFNGVNRPIYFYCFIYKNGKEYYWRDRELDFAIKGARYWASGKSFARYFGKTYTMNDYISGDDFSLLTGICREGVRWFYRLKKLEYNTPVKLEEAVKVAYEYFPKTFLRIKYGIEHQREANDVLDWNSSSY